jgi:hypothetical protein
VETTNKKKGRKRRKYKPAQERMPQLQHCPLAKHREDDNPKYHKEQKKS